MGRKSGGDTLQRICMKEASVETMILKILFQGKMLTTTVFIR